MTGRQAGSSADDIARRTREKIARLERSAASWEAGAAGERVVGEVVDRLTASGWTVLHDVAWPGRQRANIDHIAVGPGGVFVVDAKNWSGRLEVRDGQLRQNGRSRHAALEGVARATVAVMAFNPRVATYGVLCLVGDEPRRDVVAGVTVCSSTSLLDVVGSAPAVLTPEQVAEVSRELADKLSRSEPVSEAVPQRPARRAGQGRGRSSSPSLARLVGFLAIVAVLAGSFQAGLLTQVGDYLSDVAISDTGELPVKQKEDRDGQQKRRER